MKPLPNRQVHLDFHTSEHMPGIGDRFSKKQWQEALILGHVNQINIFAKCHHSFSYYPTKVGKVHPNLKFDLLGAQLEACQEIGVESPIYYTVGWSAMDAEIHPDWVVRKKDGSYHTNSKWDFTAGADTPKPQGWKWLCAVEEGPYHAHIMAQVEELCRSYRVDGFWFDIYMDNECHCQTCQDRMRKEGVDMSNPSAVLKSYLGGIRRHSQAVKALILKYHPKATVFFNGFPKMGPSQRLKEKLYLVNTHQELEDLPTTWGGYDKLPFGAKFHLGHGYQVAAMSGKFHKSWGEFGGFKHPDGLKYEAAAMIAQGAACNFGDHMHPSGELDLGTYGNLGEAFKYVETIEAYGPGGVPCSKLGLWMTHQNEPDQGATSMLLELHRDFVIAEKENLSSLTTVVLPSHAALTPDEAKALNQWVAAGGRLIVFGEGALDTGKTRFQIDVGCEFLEPSPFVEDYTMAGPELAPRLVPTPFLNYKSALRTRLTGGKALAMIREPYFNRTYGKYCGHANTPNQLVDSPYPALVRHGNVIYFPHALDRMYHSDGVRLHRDLFAYALETLDPEPVLKVDGLPSGARVNLLHQKDEGRYVAHLLYAPVIQRGSVKVIEDFPKMSEVRVTLRVSEKISSVKAIPSGTAVSTKQAGNAVEAQVPPFSMHTALVFSYGKMP